MSSTYTSCHFSGMARMPPLRCMNSAKAMIFCGVVVHWFPGPIATSKVSGRAYCNLTGPGVIASVDLDATPPTAKLIYTGGKGGGHSVASADGRFIYTVQDLPREGNATHAGSPCQVGQLVMVDLRRLRVTRVIRLPRPGAMPQDVKLSPDGRLFYVADMMAGGLWEIDAAHPRVVGFLPTGQGAHGLYPSRDSRLLYVSNRGAGTVSVVSFASRRVGRLHYDASGSVRNHGLCLAD